MRHLITPMDLSVEETMNILDLAERISIGPQLYKHVADGRQLALTDKEYQILLLLISHPTKTFSTQNIFESVWNEPYTQFSNNTIMVHIKNLRNKLEAGCGCAHLIKTVWGKGYKFEE